MKLDKCTILMFILLGGSFLHGMQESNNPSRNANYRDRAVARILKAQNQIKNSEVRLPDSLAPLEIVGFLKTLHDNNWY